MILNKTIKLKKNLRRGAGQAINSAKKILKEIGIDNLDKFKKHYIYFDGVDISDLIVIECIRDNWSVKNTTDVEWTFYFNKYLV